MSWLEEYTTALSNRDAVEKANAPTIRAYTTLAARTTLLESTARSQATTDTPATPAAAPRIPPSFFSSSTAPAPAESETVAALRADLTSAHKSKAQLSSTVTSLEAQLVSLRETSTAQAGQLKTLGKRIGHLETDRALLQRRIKDREEELKEQRRLVERVQDEMVGLDMQLNVAEERRKEVEKENSELLERYKERVRREVEEVSRGL